ncbi:S16 family serine protease [Piscibacillus salipiscarius]|uniref:S16 family serine protease n=1 Tax=Piscibacillus salipiscarius TaxID=299480 RepID=UPI0034E2F891
MTDRDVTVNPEVEFDSGSIGGPSAGLMMSLEIYDQLTSEDITKGYQIAGTGEIDYEGNVSRIGGIDKKL